MHNSINAISLRLFLGDVIMRTLKHTDFTIKPACVL